MRVALVTANFRARAPFDLDSHVRSLAPALARAGARVEVFCAVRDSGLAPFAQRRVEAIDHVSGSPFGVTSIEAPVETPAEARGSGSEGERPGGRGGAVRTDERDDRLAEGFGAFLDRERPTVVHFERLDAFGTGLVREAKSRGIATVYCASDTWPAHDRVSLLLPDLTPFELGDGEPEARALIAEKELGPVPQTGSFDDAAKDARLKELLHGPITAMKDVASLRDATEEIDVRRAKKRAALSAVDRRFATSRLLAKDLSAAVGRAFTFRAAGIDASLFHAPAEAPDRDGETVRFTFLGSTAPETGIDRLLDAFAALRAEHDPPDVQLTFHLACSDDPVRDAAIAERVELLGVESRWTRGPIDAALALDEADAVVMPSIWSEVSPAICRIALATGRPLIASRTSGVMEAMPSTAGVLVSSTEPRDLVETLGRLARNHDDLAALTQGARDAARATKNIEDEAREWLDTYGQMKTARPETSWAASHSKVRPAAESTLPGVSDVAALLRQLEDLSTAELFARAQEGVGKLRKAFGLKDSGEDLLGRVVARGGTARDRAEYEATLEEQVDEALASLHAARLGIESEEAARSQRLAELHAVLGAYEREVQSRSEAAEEAVNRAREAESRVEDAQAEIAAAEERVKTAAEEARAEASQDVERAQSRSREVEEATQAKLEALAAEADKARVAFEEVELERERLVATLDERDRLVVAMRQRLGAGEAESARGDGRPPRGDESRDLRGELESIEAFCVALERDTESLRSHDEWMRTEADRLIEALGAAANGELPSVLRSEQDDAPVNFERGFAMLEHLRSELEWRRKEMADARTASSSLRAKMLAGPLASRVRSWGDNAPWSSVPMDRTPEATVEFDEPDAALPSGDPAEDDADDPSGAATTEERAQDAATS